MAQCEGLKKASSSFSEMAEVSTSSSPKTSMYSPALTFEDQPDSRRRVQSADSAKKTDSSGWSHALNHQAQAAAYSMSPAKSIASSGNTSSARAVGGAVWAALGMLGGSNPLSGSWKAPIGNSTATPPKPSQHGQGQAASSSPYGTPPVKPHSNMSPPGPRAVSVSNSDDFVMINRLPQRPWRAVESESVSLKDFENSSRLSPVQEQSVLLVSLHLCSGKYFSLTKSDLVSPQHQRWRRGTVAGTS